MQRKDDCSIVSVAEENLEPPLAWASAVDAKDGVRNALNHLDALELAPPGYDQEARRPQDTLARLDALELAPPAVEKANGQTTAG